MSMPQRVASTQPLPRLSSFATREIIQLEGQALASLARRIDGDVLPTRSRCCSQCRGSVIASGMGKAGLIGQKDRRHAGLDRHAQPFPASRRSGSRRPGPRSTATTSLLVLSQSGETEEVVRLLPSLAEFGVPMMADHRPRASTLGRAAAVTIELGPLEEACSLGLAPAPAPPPCSPWAMPWRW